MTGGHTFRAACLASLVVTAVTHAHAERLRVIDGDTIILGEERIRSISEDGPIDAPEMKRGQCPLELYRAQAARERLRTLLSDSDFSVERQPRLDKY